MNILLPNFGIQQHFLVFNNALKIGRKIWIYICICLRTEHHEPFEISLRSFIKNKAMFQINLWNKPWSVMWWEIQTLSLIMPGCVISCTLIAFCRQRQNGRERFCASIWVYPNWTRGDNSPVALRSHQPVPWGERAESAEKARGHSWVWDQWTNDKQGICQLNIQYQH